MRRNRHTGLTPNESLILVIAADLLTAGHGVVHGYQLASEISKREGKPMSYSTVYRCLDRLEDMGLLSASWELDERQGPPRRVYELSLDGAERVALIQSLPSRRGSKPQIIPPVAN